MSKGCRWQFYEHADALGDLLKLEIDLCDVIVLVSYAFEIFIIALSYTLLKRKSVRSENELQTGSPEKH